MRRLAISVLVILAGTAGATGVAHAQGTLAAMGLGYPPGGVSARIMGAAAAAAELDAASAVNPAALVQSTTFEVFAQAHVEQRRTEVADPSSTSVIPSFPLVGISLPISQRLVIGISLASYLDRTWGLTSETPLTLDGTTVIARDRATSEGGMTDVRFAAGYRLGTRVALGAAVHVITGENRLELSRSFVDAPDFGTFTQSSVVDYFGNAFSVGVMVAPTDRVTIGASAQLGNGIDSRERDSVIATATVPSRVGISGQYRLPGAALSARVGWTQWSDLSGFAQREASSSSTLDARDGWEYSVGADVDGPRVFGQSVVLRTGLGHRDLPFGLNGNGITETQVTGGLGIPLARGRALLDLAVVRASRSGVSGASERGWITSVGILLRP